MKTQAVLAAVAAFALAHAAVPAAAQTSVTPELVRRECSTCHGPRGISVSPTFPNLAAQQAPYLEAQLKAFRDRSRADPHAQSFMWGMAAQLTDGAIAEIATYYASQPAATGARAGAAEIAAGQKIYEEGVEAQHVVACQSCHMKKGVGSGPFPRLASQRRAYLEKQLEAFATNLRANAVMHENSKNLTALQISQLAAFLSAE